MKKIFSILLCILVCLTVFPRNAYADEYISKVEFNEPKYKYSRMSVEVPLSIPENTFYDYEENNDAEYDQSSRYMFDEYGNCIYYQTLESGSVLKKSDNQPLEDLTVLPFETKIVVFDLVLEAENNQFPFGDATTVELGSNNYISKIDDAMKISKDSTGIISVDGYTGFYITDESMKMHIQLAVDVPSAEKVTSLDLTYSGFDYDNYNLNVSFPDEYAIDTEVVSLYKDNNPKYIITEYPTTAPGMRILINRLNPELSGSFDKSMVSDVDFAAVGIVLSSKTYGKLFDEETKIKVNGVEFPYQFTTEPGRLRSVNFGANENTPTNCWAINDGDVETIMVVICFNEGFEPAPVHHDTGHHVVLNTGVN